MKLLVVGAMAFHTFPLISREIDLISSASISNFRNLQYFVEMSIGTPNQDFTFLLDTGSAWLWIPSRSCSCKQAESQVSSCKCHESKKFDESLSTSFSKTGNATQAFYSVGYIAGDISTETVTIKNLTAHSQNFILVYKEQALQNVVSDGLLGLGFNSLSKGYPTLIETLKAQDQIETSSFSLFFSSGPGSFISIGGSDLADFDTNSKKTLKVTKEFGYWTTVMDSWTLAGRTYKDYTIAIIDSGTSAILGPNSQISLIKNYLKYKFECEQYNILFCRCQQNELENFPNFYINMHGFSVEIKAKDYVYYYKGTCYVLIDNSNDFYWVLGQPFLRDRLATFDMEQELIILYDKKISQSENQVSSILLFGIFILGAIGFLAASKYLRSSETLVAYTRIR